MASFLTAMAFSASADSADDPVFHLDIPCYIKNMDGFYLSLTEGPAPQVTLTQTPTTAWTVTKEDKESSWGSYSTYYFTVDNYLYLNPTSDGGALTLAAGRGDGFIVSGYMYGAFLIYTESEHSPDGIAKYLQTDSYGNLLLSTNMPGNNGCA